MSEHNQVQLIGNLSRDSEVKFFDSGNCLTKFSLAVSNGKDKPAHFFDVQIWGELDPSLSQALVEGARVIANGRLVQEKWTDRETGKGRSKVIVVANSLALKPWEPRPEQPATQPASRPSAPKTAPKSAPALALASTKPASKPEAEPDYDDIPF